MPAAIPWANSVTTPLARRASRQGPFLPISCSPVSVRSQAWVFITMAVLTSHIWDSLGEWVSSYAGQPLHVDNCFHRMKFRVGGDQGRIRFQGGRDGKRISIGNGV